MKHFTPPSTVGISEVRAARELLDRYRAAKSRLDSRICEEMTWWQSRHSAAPAAIRRRGAGARPTSAWLFNSVCNKHADLCDATPTCVALPREPDDVAEAALLSDILPVIAQRCSFAKTYSDNAWTKLKHGMAAYGVFWNTALESGLGDIDICRVDVLNLFWDPAVRDLQDSPHLFLVGTADTADLEIRYPQFCTRPSIPDAGVTDGKTQVIDWYYKRLLPTGRTVLHYVKFADDILLYASENDPATAEVGWYAHGRYPFVLDVLYPEEGTPAGYGLIAVGRDPQGYIDELDGHILEYANQASRVRYWAKRSLGIDQRAFLDPDRRIIEVEGDIDEEKLRQITLSPMDGMLCDVRRMKIDELKETTGNRDVSQGSTTGGITAASAITALQEAGNKGSRDMLAASYRAYVQVMEQVIELIRQFYDGVRCFRIRGRNGSSRFVRYDHTALCERPVGVDGEGNSLYRRPCFDLEVRAERENPLDRTGRNQLMMELFSAGFFDPERASAAAQALSGMDFEGADRLRLALAEGTASEVTV